tara:strand:+ start:113736 stop:113921 length:186 start_codon:yes stop_codon:yes gene_type:complete
MKHQFRPETLSERVNHFFCRVGYKYSFDLLHDILGLNKSKERQEIFPLPFLVLEIDNLKET